jgi:hypothetical protein
MKESIVNLERIIDWCDKYEKPLVLAGYIATLILGGVLYCHTMNGGGWFFDWVMTPFGYLMHVMNWFCGC